MTTDITFEAFPKIGRLSRGMTITEKLDGTNAQIIITDDGRVAAGSRTRLITPGKLTDNFGFAGWVEDHKDELLLLGPGRHFGEWWGHGIQRRYDLKEKRFSLFNANRWTAPNAVLPPCCSLVPVLFRGEFNSARVDLAMKLLKQDGSWAAPGFMNPEGIIILHEATRTLYKKTYEHDEKGKEFDIAA